MNGVSDVRRLLTLKRRKCSPTATTAADRMVIEYPCPWCGQPMTVVVEIGAIHYSKGRSSRRTTGITSRRTEAVYHDCP